MNEQSLPKLKKRTLVEDFIRQFEEMILSGQLKAGEKLPSERDLAARLGVSRPVVHEGLISLAAKGLVSRYGQNGTVINDYRKNGSLAILNSLLRFQDGMLDPQLADNTMDFRFLVETENARLAARNRTPAELEEMHAIVAAEKSLPRDDVELMSELDFRFHHQIAMATGNLFYSLLFNSFKPFYMHHVRQFFRIPEYFDTVYQFHQQLTAAIAAQDETLAAEIMQRMLEHGKTGYQRLLST